MPGADFLPLVREQYEAFPYPPRDPGEERHRLIHRIGDNLITLNHHCFAGARDFHGFRALVAGGGTGDSTIYLAEQLRDFDAEIIHLDLSDTSMAVAAERARVRNLANVRFVNASIMNLPELGLGEFDYINCTGVLHHLASSEAGLAVLKRMLRADGAILVMLYGKYGRRSVYDMQALLRQYLPPGTSITGKVRLARQLLAALPPTNSFIRDLDTWRHEIAPEGFGDAGLYDLLLHSQDRCFDVPDLYRLADSADLEILAFVDRAAAYDPRSHLAATAPALHLEALDLRTRQAVAELMVGDLVSHEFYLGRRGINRCAALDNERNALVMVGAMHGRHREIGAGLAPGKVVRIQGRCGTVVVTGNAVNRVLFALMDGVTPLGEIYDRIQASVPGLSRTDLRNGIGDLYRTLHAHGHLFLLEAGSYGVKVPDYSRIPPP
jgi:ubiquinone/menaquinone biosynthesis C-methylase UbiE